MIQIYEDWDDHDDTMFGCADADADAIADADADDTMQCNNGWV